MATSEKGNPFSLGVRFDESVTSDKQIPLSAFLFDARGNLVDSGVVQDAKVSLNAKNIPHKSLRLFVAPTDEKQTKAVASIGDLQRFNPYETSLKASGKEFEIQPIPGLYHPIWVLHRCRVRGNVSKNFTVGTTTGLKGLCRARVHVCQIDPFWWWIDRIPDKIVLKIPQIVKYPIPIPDPIGPVEAFADSQELHRASVFAAPSAQTDLRGALEKGTAATFSADVHARLLSGNATQIRAAIKSDYTLSHPYFCHWPWFWPYLYRSHEVATLYTDDWGNFDSSVYLSWGESNLYFWVEYLIDGVWTTVYRPSIPCHTYWDYACGTPVNITVTDPRVPWACENAAAGDVIWVKTVGNAVSVSHIRQTSDIGPTIQGQPFDRIGLTDVAMPGSMANGQGYLRPFGTTLSLVAQFGDGLPAANAKYYRWSCQKVRNADLSPSSSPVRVLNDAVSKSYTYEYTDGTGTHFTSRSYALGPQVVGGVANLFQIPPVNPALAPVNATEHNAQWDQNTVVAIFDSKQLDGDGLYLFWMEVFDQTGAPVALPKAVFQVPDSSTFFPSVNAPDVNLNIDAADLSKALSFKMLMRIDNTVATAAIQKVQVREAGSYVDATPNCCGFVHYGGDAGAAGKLQLSFTAFHPQNFAWLSFDVEKGTCGSTTAASGLDENVVDGYVRDFAGTYRRQFSPNDLLGECSVAHGGDGKAAFAETLTVETLTTNGSTLAFGHAGKVVAFALEP